MEENDFHCLADAMLASLEDDLEDADQDGRLEVEMMQGVLILTLPDGKQFVISKHAPSRQLWLSSPFSGAHHFNYVPESQQWRLQDGQSLESVLNRELADVITTDR